MSEIGLLAAFGAGLLALLSPCSALLLPSFFAYAFADTRALVARTAVFYLGLLLTLVPLGTGVGAVSSLFYGHRPLLIAVAGWTIIGLGVLQLVGRGFTVPFAARLQAWSSSRPGSGWSSTLILGAVYGLAGFCSGPVLGAILTVAAVQDTPWQGGVLLAVYALGMAAPLLALAMVWDRYSLGGRRWLRGRVLTWRGLRVHTTSALSGLLLVSIGVVFLRYDGTAGITGLLGFADTVDFEFAAQERLVAWADAVPSWVVPAAVLAIAATVTARRLRASRQPASTPPEGPPAAAIVDPSLPPTRSPGDTSLVRE
ncbi:MAG: cytochrome c biogenesis CcdA family protein [Nocardioides sp.]|nr:cytochrome c biogenesis CcdA family protein [Nocardioides sp.]